MCLRPCNGHFIWYPEFPLETTLQKCFWELPHTNKGPDFRSSEVFASSSHSSCRLSIHIPGRVSGQCRLWRTCGSLQTPVICLTSDWAQECQLWRDATGPDNNIWHSCNLCLPPRERREPKHHTVEILLLGVHEGKDTGLVSRSAWMLVQAPF